MELMSIKDLKTHIKNVGGKTSHPKKEDYLAYIKSLYWYKDFPWRDEQLAVFDAFDSLMYNFIVVQGIFGVGKSQMLMGLMFKAILEGSILPTEIVYTAFNVCVKNEIKKKIASFGIKNKIKVSTFDSVIYKICKLHGMEKLDEPNYEGRRKFVYNLIHTNTFTFIFSDVKLLVLDECQDLEIQALGIFKSFYPNATCIFVGDVLQSIQKEPRESLLWQLMTNDEKYPHNEYKKIFMYETPRVPINILSSLKHALSQYYPEFSTDFDKWKSKNNNTQGHLSWHQFKNYQQMFKDVITFCSQYDHSEIMILTFSSSITVRGALGDVSRIRNLLRENNIQVNHNHKQMEQGKVFLSTSNSSKGLERKHVLIILTFPLENAFMNFSNDLIMNLITVAISRSLDTVKIYVPSIIEKFSPILKYYTDVPEPTIHYTSKIEKGKKQDEQNFNLITDYTIDSMMNKEHSVTEILRLGVLKYETISYIKSHAKFICKYKLVESYDSQSFNPCLFTDEERTLTGLFIEYLITTEWSGEWPVCNISSLADNPLYKHCFQRLETLFNQYRTMTHIPYKSCSTTNIFNVMHIYAQLQLCINHRIFVKLRENELNKLKLYWITCLKNSIVNMKPQGDFKCDIQSNCKMSFMTGIIDMMITTKTPDTSYKNATFWEIKASTDPQWEKDALSQVMLYVLMNAKVRCTVILINPLRNTVIKYGVHIPQINIVRHRAMHDCIVYNGNSLMAKTLNTIHTDTSIDTLNTLFIQLKEYDEDVVQGTVINMFSPTKMCILYNEVGKNFDIELSPEHEIYKLAMETTITKEKCIETIQSYVKEGIKIYCDETTMKYLENIGCSNVQYNIIEPLDSDYEGNSFKPNKNAFMYLVACIQKLFKQHKFSF